MQRNGPRHHTDAPQSIPPHPALLRLLLLLMMEANNSTRPMKKTKLVVAPHYLIVSLASHSLPSQNLCAGGFSSSAAILAVMKSIFRNCSSMDVEILDYYIYLFLFSIFCFCFHSSIVSSCESDKQAICTNAEE